MGLRFKEHTDGGEFPVYGVDVLTVLRHNIRPPRCDPSDGPIDPQLIFFQAGQYSIVEALTAWLNDPEAGKLKPIKEMKEESMYSYDPEKAAFIEGVT